MSDFMPEPDTYDWRNDPNLKEKWKKRFAFFDSVPPVRMFKGSPEMAARLKANQVRSSTIDDIVRCRFEELYVPSDGRDK